MLVFLNWNLVFWTRLKIFWNVNKMWKNDRVVCMKLVSVQHFSDVSYGTRIYFTNGRRITVLRSCMCLRAPSSKSDCNKKFEKREWNCRFRWEQSLKKVCKLLKKNACKVKIFGSFWEIFAYTPRENDIKNFYDIKIWQKMSRFPQFSTEHEHFLIFVQKLKFFLNYEELRKKLHDVQRREKFSIKQTSLWAGPAQAWSVRTKFPCDGKVPHDIMWAELYFVVYTGPYIWNDPKRKVELFNMTARCKMCNLSFSVLVYV